MKPLTTSGVVTNYFDDIANEGEVARPFSKSLLLIQLIIDSVTQIPDQQGVPGLCTWLAPSKNENATGAIYKLVIDMTTNTIVHFNTDG